PGGPIGDETPWGGTFQYPGNAGGFNWGSVSVDADNGLLVAAPMLMGNRIVLRSLDDRAKLMAERQEPMPQQSEPSGQPLPQGGPGGPGGGGGFGGAGGMGVPQDPKFSP